MTKQDYCPKELCLKLEAKGIHASHIRKYEKGGGWYNSYTLYVAAKWLRNVHNLHIYVFKTCNIWCFTIQRTDRVWQLNKWGAKSYEEALSAAIELCVDELID